MLDRIRALWATEPVRVTTSTVAVVVFVAAKFNVVVDEAGLLEALALVVPILLGGEAARRKVQPYQGEVGTPSDELLEDELG